MSYWDELDAMVAAAKPPKRVAVKMAKAEMVKLPKTQITPEEWIMAAKIQASVVFPVGHSHKRFMRELTDKAMLTDRGRQYLAYIAHRYRRQWQATQSELAWISKWGEWIERPKS